jgi:hypothetical protein
VKPRRAMTMDERDTDRLELLDRLADRVPELDLGQHEVEWGETPDGAQALFVGNRAEFFALYGEDLHAYGSLDPLLPRMIGCIVIRPDETGVLARAVPDPLAQRR